MHLRCPAPPSSRAPVQRALGASLLGAALLLSAPGIQAEASAPPADPPAARQKNQGLVQFDANGEVLTGHLDYAEVRVGSVSPAEGVGFVLNTGSRHARLSGARVTGDKAFRLATGPMDCAKLKSLAPDQACVIYAAFRPEHTGEVRGSYTLYTGKSGTPAMFALRGVGTGQAWIELRKTPKGEAQSMLVFPEQQPGQSASELTALLFNSGNLPAHFEHPAVQVSAPFKVTQSTCAELLPGQHCQVTFAIEAGAPGEYQADITVDANVTGLGRLQLRGSR